MRRNWSLACVWIAVAAVGCARGADASFGDGDNTTTEGGAGGDDAASGAGGVVVPPILCPDTKLACGDACFDPLSSFKHCGACDASCFGGQQCVAGACRYPDSCSDVLAMLPMASDGVFLIDPDGDGGIDPFQVDCDLTTDEGGWYRMMIDESDWIITAEQSVDNPWDKCYDDSAQYFDWILTEDQVAPDYSVADTEHVVALTYLNPGTLTPYTPEQMDVLRSLITELHVSTRMVAITSDDDSLNYQDTLDKGHEVYIKGTSQTWTLLTPGNDGDCGDGTYWPSWGSKSGYYLWHTSPETSHVDGATGISSADVEGLAPSDLLPYEVKLVVHSGGGVAFGWQKAVFLVR